MADEFIKGLGTLCTAGLGWMVLAGWYNTPTFQAIKHPQLLAPDPTNLGRIGNVALVLKDVLFWFAIIGALTFWILVPGINRLQKQ